MKSGVDVQLLQKKVAHLMKENSQLKDELHIANDKLDQIRKMSMLSSQRWLMFRGE